MALMQKSALGAKAGAFRPRVAPRVSRANVRVNAAEVNMPASERPVWFPGNPPPAYLDGKLAGDFGFDPLRLGSDPGFLNWFVHAELIHCRWAMLGAAGVLFTGIGAQVGIGFPQWYEAGKVAIENSPFSFGTLLATQFLLFGWVEGKRWADIKNPGSQGDGSFLGFTNELKGAEPGLPYPGGLWFDPLGLSRGTPEQLTKYKWNEIRNGRLAMIANLGFWSQYAATGKGPIENLADHIASPFTTTFATNGVSLPFAPH